MNQSLLSSGGSACLAPARICQALTLLQSVLITGDVLLLMQLVKHPDVVVLILDLESVHLVHSCDKESHVGFDMSPALQL